MKTHTLLSLAVFQASAGVASAACTREALTAAIDAFFAGGTANGTASALSIAPGAKITQNNKVVTSLAQTSYANITGALKPFKVNVIDTAKCQVASLRLPQEGKDKAITSVRLKFDDAGKAATEVEVMNAGPGSHPLWRPDAMPEQAEPWWSEKVKAPVTYESLQAVANSYAAGIQDGDGSKVPITDDCVRFENGQKMPFVCNGSFWLFKSPTPHRRFVVDTESGIVQQNFIFDHEKTGLKSRASVLWLHEYFKIDDGKIRKIYAAMQNYPDADYVDAWGP